MLTKLLTTKFKLLKYISDFKSPRTKSSAILNSYKNLYTIIETRVDAKIIDLNCK